MAFFDELQKRIAELGNVITTQAKSIQAQATAKSVEKKLAESKKSASLSPLSKSLENEFSNINNRIASQIPQFVSSQTPIIQTGQKFATGVKQEIATPLTKEVQRAIGQGQNIAMDVIGAPEKIIAGGIVGTLRPQQGEDLYQYFNRQPFLTDQPVVSKISERTGISPSVVMPLAFAGSLAIPGLGGEAKDAKLLTEYARLRNVEKIVPKLIENGMDETLARQIAPDIAKATTKADVKTVLKEIKLNLKVPQEGIEPPTLSASTIRSTTELPRQDTNLNITQNKNLATELSTDTLAQEAKKYNSAEEFVKAQGETLYHGFDSKSQLTDIWNKANEMPKVQPSVVEEGIKNAEEKFAKDQKIITQKGLTADVQKPSFWYELKRSNAPMKYAGDTVKNAWKKRVSDTLVGNELANKEFQKLEHLPGGLDSMIQYQTGNMQKNFAYARDVQKTFDNLLDEANARGIQVGRRENYLPQVYVQTPEQITDAISLYMKDNGISDKIIREYLNGKPLPGDVSTTLKLNPTFSKERVFPNYGVAMQYGLTPKYTHPAQLAAYYRNELEKTIANRNFVQTMKNEGELIGVKAQGYKPVDIPYSTEELYAKPKTARALNEYFRDENNLGIGARIVKFTSNLNRRMQDFILSGGVPNTNVNFFTIGQGTIKDMTAGETKVIGNVLRSNFDTATQKWFRVHQPYIDKMAEEGINMSGRVGNWDTVYKQLSAKTGIAKTAENIGKGFDILFNKKTFKSFMPMQITSHFRQVYDKALEKGLSAKEAQKLAGDSAKAYAGIVEDWGRGKTFQDVINTLFFAPRYRESLINFFANTGKSITTEIGNPAFSRNRKFIIGAALSYATYNILNKKLNGNYIWENEAGKEFDLKIPIGNDEFIYIAFLPSVLSFPRNMISGSIALSKGDLQTAGQKFGSLLSMPIKLQSEVISNRDYFGREIYDPEDTRTGKIASIAKYVGLSYNHPYAIALYNLIAPEKQKKNWVEVIARSAELPIKFNTLSKIQKSEFYNALDKQKKVRQKDIERVKEIYDKNQALKSEGKADEAETNFDNLSDNDKKIYRDIKSSEKSKATNELKSRIYPIFKHNQELKAQGKADEAERIYDNLSDEEQRVYGLIKKTFYTETR